MSLRFLIYLIILAVNLVYGFIVLKKLSKPFHPLVLLLGITFISEICTRLLIHKIGFSNPIYHLFLPIQYALFSVIYDELFPNRYFRIFLIVSVSLLVPFCSLNSLFIQSIKYFPTYPALALCLFMTIQSLVICLQMLKKTENIPLTRQAIFWFNITNLINFSLMFFIWLCHNILVGAKNMPRSAYDFMAWLNISTYIIYFWVLYLARNRAPKPHK